MALYIPLRFETVEDSLFARPIGPNADGLQANGFYPQNASSVDAAVGVERSAGGDLVLKDGVLGSRTLSQLANPAGIGASVNLSGTSTGSEVTTGVYRDASGNLVFKDAVAGARALSGEAWILVSVWANGFSDWAGSEWNPTSYCKDVAGNVHLRIAVKGSATSAMGVRIFQMPAGYRPAAATCPLFAAVAYGFSWQNFAVVGIQPNGDVRIESSAFAITAGNCHVGYFVYRGEQ